MRQRLIFKKKGEIQVQEEPADQELSISATFVNRLKNPQWLQLYEIMLKNMKYIERINPQHIKAALAEDELMKMTGHKYGDGKFVCFFYYHYNSFRFRCPFC